MKFAFGCDHAGYDFKELIIKRLAELGHEVVDFGTDSRDSVDYPIYGEAAARAVASGECDMGILVCGSGVGISLCANKVRGIRAVVCSEPFSAMMSRRHNNANMLCMGARVIGSEMALMILDSFLNAEFEGGKHERRVSMITDIENKF